MEFTMSIKTHIAALSLAALATTGSIASTTPAEAKGLGWAVGAGIVGAAVVGSAIAASQPYPYYGYAHCGYVRQFDAWGHYVGTIRTCY
jgi:hypothetical protein